MSTDVFFIVLAAAALHATWNAMAKGRQGSDPLAGSVVIAVGAAMAAVPILLLAGMPSSSSMPYVIASGIIHVGYFLLLGLGYRLADYSAVYPLTRGSAPLLTTAGGVLLVGEQVGPVMLAGVVLLSTGVLGLSLDALRRGGIDARGLAVAAANIGIIVAYTLIDGLGARLSGNPAGYVAAMMLVTGALLLPLAAWLRPGSIVLALRTRWAFGLLAGTFVMASYGAALWAMTRAPIGAVAALRETSVLFGTLIATFFLKERFGPSRVLATLAILAGLLCIRWI